MKNLIVIAIILMISAGNVQAQTWASLKAQGDATYIGGYYAAVSYACLRTDYTNDSGYWKSGPATIPYKKGCAKSLFDAFFGEVATPYAN